MSEHYLIVTNPPHGTVDNRRAAPCLGWSAADVQMRAHHQAPEIWLAETSMASAQEKGKHLRASGINLALVPGSVLAAVPEPEHVNALVHSDAGFAAKTDSGSLDLTPNAPVIAVLAQPAQGSDEALRSGAASTSLFIDIYLLTVSGWQVGRLSTEHVDFSELGDFKQPTASGNLHAFIDELRSSHARARIDERLVNVSYRYTMVSGQAMPKLLEAISPDLPHIGHLDLASRLAFLTTKGPRLT